MRRRKSGRRIDGNCKRRKREETMNGARWEMSSLFFSSPSSRFDAGISHCKYSCHLCQVMLINTRLGLLESLCPAISNVCSSDRMCNHGQILIKCWHSGQPWKLASGGKDDRGSTLVTTGEARLEQTGRPHVVRCGYVYMWLILLRCVHRHVI